MSAATQPLLIPDDKPAEDQQPTSPEDAVITDAARLVDAARLPETCWDRAHGHVYPDALTRLAKSVDRMRTTHGDPRDGTPAATLDADLHFVAPGEIAEIVDSHYYVAALTVASCAERLAGSLGQDIDGTPIAWDDHTTAGIALLRDALTRWMARHRQLHTLRGEQTPDDSKDET